jgi:23S rRNA U2552 (ribose-2'-O)-methylase RlmE/FtsJ
MYKYVLNYQYEKYYPIIKSIYIPINENGFADILSIDLENTLKIRKAKNKINQITPYLWEDIKKYTNPYELIYIFNNKLYKNFYKNTDDYYNYNTIKSIANIKPLSRSFFKMIEIIYEFIPNIFIYERTINSLHIAEGPGGFIEATRYLRQLNPDYNISNNDKAFGITLIDNTQKNVPAWKQSNLFIKNHPEVIISTGSDGTGNIYNIDNILSLNNLIKLHSDKNITNNSSNIGMIDFITADGGFDYSIDYNYQEQASSKLIFCEIITALKYQRIGGDFVCKIFDLNSYITIEMLYILYLAYNKITIYKPLTSRFANSEKYIICNNFIGINNEFLDNLFNVLNEWNKNNGISALNQLMTEIPIQFIEKMKTINTEIINKQIQTINNIVNIINTKTNLNKQWKKENIEKQINNAKNWCAKYKIPFIQ